MAKFAGLRDPVTFDFENSTIAYCVDAFCISMGALMGTSPVTSFVESATGISGTCWMADKFLSSAPYTTIRGRQDWLNCGNDGTRILRFDILCSDLCIYTTLGYWWCARYCGFDDGSKVRFLF